MEQLQKLKEIIKNSNNIVFFGGAGVSLEFQPKVTFQILEVILDYINKKIWI